MAGSNKNVKGKLRLLDASVDLDMIFSIHPKRTVRKNGTIMFIGEKWPIGCPKETTVTVCLISSVKFMVYRDYKKIGDFHL